MASSGAMIRIVEPTEPAATLADAEGTEDADEALALTVLLTAEEAGEELGEDEAVVLTDADEL